MVVGNKSDRTKERVVSIEEGRRLALVGVLKTIHRLL